MTYGILPCNEKVLLSLLATLSDDTGYRLVTALPSRVVESVEAAETLQQLQGHDFVHITV